MWFLSSILVNCALMTVISHTTKNKVWLALVLVAVVFILMILIPDGHVKDVHKFMFPFFAIGYFMHHYNLTLYFSRKTR